LHALKHLLETEMIFFKQTPDLVIVLGCGAQPHDLLQRLLVVFTGQIDQGAIAWVEFSSTSIKKEYSHGRCPQCCML
jgi:hypothetical protein